MAIKVNGEERKLPDGTTVSGLLELHGLSPGKVAIELNRRLVQSHDYGQVLNDGDEIEIVTFVGGG